MKKISFKRKEKEQPANESELQVSCECAEVEKIVKENKVGELIEKIQIAIKNSKYSEKFEYVSTIISYVKDSLANNYKTRKKFILTAIRVLISAGNYIVNKCDDETKDSTQNQSLISIFEPIQQEIQAYKLWKDQQSLIQN